MTIPEDEAYTSLISGGENVDKIWSESLNNQEPLKGKNFKDPYYFRSTSRIH